MESEGRPRNSSGLALAAICGLLIVYVASLFAGMPQRGTAAVLAAPGTCHGRADRRG